MQSNQVILHEAISSSLLSLGDSIMKTIVWHLNAQGVFLDSKTEIRIDRLNDHLQAIVGNLADDVMDEILKRLKVTDPALATQVIKMLEGQSRRGDTVA